MEGINIAKYKQTSLKQPLEYDNQDLYENNELKEKNLNKDTGTSSSLNEINDDDQNHEVFNVGDNKIMILKGNHPWKCTFERCDKAFKFRCRLQKHEKTHSDERSFICPELGCGKSYRRIDHLRMHSIVHCEDTKPFKCSIEGCESKFSYKHHLLRHKKEQHDVEKPFKCYVQNCNQSFTQDYLLRSHMTVHTGTNPYPCEHPGCTKSFSSSTKLKDHGRVHSEQKRWRCALQGCTQDFQKYHQLCRHLRQDHRPTCEICNQKVKDFKQLRLHMKTHDSNRLLFPCSWEGCDKYFSNIKSLNVHTKATHKDIRPFVCEVPGCEMSFAYKNVLTNHVKIIHEKSRSCTIHKFKNDVKTNKQVTDIEHLTGYDYERGRNIRCTVKECKYMFKRNYDLERHVKSFHKNLFKNQETEEKDDIETNNANENI